MSGAKMKNGLVLGLLISSLAACGGDDDPRTGITVNLTTAGQSYVDPYQNDRLVLVRAEIDGPDRQDAVLADIPLDQRSAVFEDYPAGNEVTVIVGGYDEAGNLVAFGRKEGVKLDEESESVTVDIPFRRNLAFVVHHQDDPPQGRNTMYVLDVTTRALVDRIRIGGPNTQDPIANGISAIDGDGVAVPYCDVGAQSCSIGLYSLADGTWRTIPAVEVGASARPAVQYSQVALGTGQKFGAVAGDGALSVIDTESLQVVFSQPVGGRLVDSALGRAGRVAVFSSDQNILRVELDKFADEGAKAVIGEMILDGGCAGISADGQISFVATAQPAAGGGDQVIPTVTGTDLVRGTQNVFGGFTVSPLGPGVFSERMEGMVCLVQDEDAPRAAAWSPLANGGQGAGFPFQTDVGCPPNPMDIAAAPMGRRLIAVSAGTDAASAGLCVIDTEFNPDFPMDASVTAYPSDPDDCEQIGTDVNGKPILACNNYRPIGIAILYGR